MKLYTSPFHEEICEASANQVRSHKIENDAYSTVILIIFNIHYPCLCCLYTVPNIYAVILATLFLFQRKHKNFSTWNIATAARDNAEFTLLASPWGTDRTQPHCCNTFQVIFSLWDLENTLFQHVNKKKKKAQPSQLFFFSNLAMLLWLSWTL